MILSLADYAALAAIFLAVALRISADVRDVAAALAAKKTAKALAGRRFSPRLTVVVPFRSLENAKHMLEHLSQQDYPVTTVIAVDSSVHPKAASALRYFIGKQSLERAKVTARKAPDLAVIAGEYAKTGLVVVFPETARLHKGLYDSAILPLGDETVGAVRLTQSVRPDNTLISGIETLFVSWRQYVTANGIRRVRPQMPSGPQPEGVLMRAKHVRKTPKQKLQVVDTRRAAYSIAAQGSTRTAWEKLQKKAPADYSSIFIMTLIVILTLSSQATVLFTTGVLVLLYGVLAWGALGAMRIVVTDRVAVLLLAPFFLPIAWGLSFAHGFGSIRKVRLQKHTVQ